MFRPDGTPLWAREWRQSYASRPALDKGGSNEVRLTVGDRARPAGPRGAGAHYWDVRRHFNSFQLRLLVEADGFAVTESRGAPDPAPFWPRSYNMIVVARRRQE